MVLLSEELPAYSPINKTNTNYGAVNSWSRSSTDNNETAESNALQKEMGKLVY